MAAKAASTVAGAKKNQENQANHTNQGSDNGAESHIKNREKTGQASGS